MATSRLASAASRIVLAGLAALAGDTGVAVLETSEGTNFAVDVAPGGGPALIDLQGRLWLVPAGGGAPRALSDGMGDDRLPHFSPAGRWICFQSFRSGSWNVWVMRSDGSDARPVVSAAGDEREPAWSRDGRELFFAADYAGNYDI